MTYAIVVPGELLGELVAIRSATGMSIRSQIIRETKLWIEEFRRSPNSFARKKGPYWCTPCQRDFMTPEAWDRHLAEHREQKRDFKPLMCEEKAHGRYKHKEVKP